MHTRHDRHESNETARDSLKYTTMLDKTAPDASTFYLQQTTKHNRKAPKVLIAHLYHDVCANEMKPCSSQKHDNLI